MTTWGNVHLASSYYPSKSKCGKVTVPSRHGENEMPDVPSPSTDVGNLCTSIWKRLSDAWVHKVPYLLLD